MALLEDASEKGLKGPFKEDLQPPHAHRASVGHLKLLPQADNEGLQRDFEAFVEI